MYPQPAVPMGLPVAAAAVAAPRERPANYKTVLCHNWEANGVCQYGARCNFAHGQHELRPAPAPPAAPVPVPRPDPVRPAP
eukprot:5144756-Prymnesium_polylepis.1